MDRKTDDISIKEDKGIRNFEHEELSDLSDRSNFKMLGSLELNTFQSKFASRGNYNSHRPVKVEFEPTEEQNTKPYIIYEGSEKISYLGIVTAKELYRIEREHPYDDILSLNIRHGLGNSKINKEIIDFIKKDINLIIKYMKSDKKNNSSKINLILIKKIGKIILDLKFKELKIKKFLNKELIY